MNQPPNQPVEVVVQPQAPQPAAPQPVAPQPVAAQPVAAQPVAVEPAPAPQAQPAPAPAPAPQPAPQPAAEPAAAVAVVQPTAGALMEAPDYGEALVAGDGTEDLARYMTPSRLKIVQKMSDSALTEKFGLGSIIIDGEELLAPMGKDLVVCPLYFFVSWVTLNPYKLKETHPWAAAQSMDPTSEIAQKAQDSSTWEEVIPEYANHPEKEKYTWLHREMLNYMVLVPTSSDPDMPMLVSFLKSSYYSGKSWNKLMKKRKRKGIPMPIYSGNYTMRVSMEKMQSTEIAVPKVSNPPEGLVSPWATGDEFLVRKRWYEELRGLDITIQDDDDVAGAGEENPNAINAQVVNSSEY